MEAGREVLHQLAFCGYHIIIRNYCKEGEGRRRQTDGALQVWELDGWRGTFGTDRGSWVPWVYLITHYIPATYVLFYLSRVLEREQTKTGVFIRFDRTGEHGTRMRPSDVM